jgi:hypothetical protein
MGKNRKGICPPRYAYVHGVTLKKIAIFVAPDNLLEDSDDKLSPHEGIWGPVKVQILSF